MKKLQLLIYTSLILSSCDLSDPSMDAKHTTPAKDSTKEQLAQIDTTPRVIGIGGIFFFSEDPKSTKEWYSKNLGFPTDQYGHIFESRDLNDPNRINNLQWSPFKTGNSYFEPSKKPYMINYIVRNIEGLVRNLKANGVTICDTLETYDYGKFIHIMDPDGNKIELWEANDKRFNDSTTVTK